MGRAPAGLTLNGDPILTQDKLDTYLAEADIPDDAVEDTNSSKSTSVRSTVLNGRGSKRFQ